MAEDERMSDDPDTPLLTYAQVDAWRNELAQLTEEMQSKGFGSDLIRRRLAAAQILIDAKREAEFGHADTEQRSA